MASQIMEIIIFDVQPIITINPHSLLTNSVWNDTLPTLKQQNGVRAVHWGQTIESQNKVYLLIDWIATQHCVKFEQSTGFAAFQMNLDLIALGAPRMLYAPIAPQMYPQIFNNVLTEIAIFSSYNSSFIDTFDGFSSVIKRSQGCTGVAKDIATNEIPGDVGEGGSEKLYVAMIGWLDLATHRTAMDSVAFKENVPSVEACVQVITVYHIKLVTV
ncbi:uncharacterized protein TrAtP1_005244 [Trichoderma atroviride]|uniref:uncharacterized protein n=1 Tax=Hypocrea atroviridis TaxID=63577 RepID=UPI00332B3AD7|nr:hypothetical protein TrAtP1_005244 [Trichoderma atroviride]